jgi:SagB-type dehydrogenase family enzyme
VTAAVRYRASPNLVAYWRDGGFFVLNFATKVEIRALPVVADLLSALNEWRTAGEVGLRLGLAADAPALTLLIESLRRASIVQCSNTAQDPRDVAMATWGAWNPSVGHFHGMTTGVTYLENDLPASGRSRAWPAAQPFVTRRGRRVPLERPSRADEFSDVLIGRRTWRRFRRSPLPRESVGALLWLTAGVQAWLRTPRGERLALKTSPSGGARHPLDLYVLAKHVKGLPSGFYRYDGVTHELISIGPPASRQNRVYLPRQYWYEDAAAIVFFCAKFGRTFARYQYPRAYRAVLIEAGHLCQTFCLTATWLGLAPFSTLALDDRRIESDLGLDGIIEGVVYAAGVGAAVDTAVPSAPRDVKGVSIHSRRTTTRSSKGRK